MKGIYLLILHLSEAVSDVQIGRLTPQHFAAGYYLYVGNAYGPGGLEARLAHHRQRYKQHPREHIDFLRPHGALLESWSIGCEICRASPWASALLQVPALSTPVPGFAGQVGCPSRLLYTPLRPSLRSLTESLLESLGMERGQQHYLQLEITIYEELQRGGTL